MKKAEIKPSLTIPSIFSCHCSVWNLVATEMYRFGTLVDNLPNVIKLKSKIGLAVKTKGKKVKSDCLNFRIVFLSKINKNIKNAINMMTDWYLSQKDIARKNPISKKSGIVFCFFVMKNNATNIKKRGAISFNTITDKNAIFALTAKNNCVTSATFLSKRFFVIKYERNTIPVPLISEIIFPAVNASPSRLPRVAWRSGPPIGPPAIPRFSALPFKISSPAI